MLSRVKTRLKLKACIHHRLVRVYPCECMSVLRKRFNAYVTQLSVISYKFSVYFKPWRNIRPSTSSGDSRERRSARVFPTRENDLLLVKYASVESIPAGIPQLSDPSPRYSRNIHTHTRGKPADNAGFPPSHPVHSRGPSCIIMPNSGKIGQYFADILHLFDSSKWG